MGTIQLPHLAMCNFVNCLSKQFGNPCKYKQTFAYVYSHEKRTRVQDYLCYVKYKDLCSTINPSTLKISNIENHSKILQEESHTIDLLSIQIDKYKNISI